MNSCEAHLDRIEAQRSTGVSHDERKQRYSPIILIKRTLRSLGVLQVEREGTPSTRDTKSVPEFLINIKLSDLFNLPSEFVLMNPKIFSEVSAGNKKCLEKLRSYGTQMACLKTERGDSMLHLVAAWGHLELLKSIVTECPSLLLVPNSKDQLPLHVAASAGHLHVVKALVAIITFVSSKLSEEESGILNLYIVKDKDGDTPLHAALKAHHMAIAASLTKANQQASFLANKNNISPLYLAVESGNVSLVRAMLNTTCNDDLERRDSNLHSKLEGRRNLVHAALKAKNTDVLDVILKECPSLEDERDEEGMTCLSFGASIGFYKGVCNLLDRSTKSVYVCNDDGSFPIHIAVEKNHTQGVVMELIKRCPDSKYLLNKQGRNILHIAAKSGRTRPFLLGYIRKLERKKNHLLVEQDVDGNTALHLATINWRPYTIFLLLIFNGEKNWKYTRNNSGLTALDIAESNLQPNYIFMERVTLMMLLYFHTSSSSDAWFKKITKPSKPLEDEKTKNYVNTLLVVAALVATVTFAAGFTIPGGFNDSAPNLGMATLAHHPSLVLFIVFDSLAMQSSVTTIVTLIWSQFGDPTLVHRSLNMALPLLFFSLLCMAVAFYCGVLVAFSQVIELVVFLSVIFVIFFCRMLFALGPHVILQIPGIPAAVGAYFIPFVMNIVDDREQYEQTSTKKISGKDLIGKKESN